MQCRLAAALTSLSQIQDELATSIFRIDLELSAMTSDPENFTTEPHVMFHHRLPTGRFQKRGTLHSIPFSEDGNGMHRLTEAKIRTDSAKAKVYLLDRKRRELEDLSERIRVARGIVKKVELPIKLLACDSIANVKLKTFDQMRSAILGREVPKKRVAKSFQKQPDWLGSPAKFEFKEEEVKVNPIPQPVLSLPPVVLQDGNRTLWSTQTVKIKVSNLSTEDQCDLNQVFTRVAEVRSGLDLLRKDVRYRHTAPPLEDYLLKVIEKRRNQIKASLDWFLECFLFPLNGLGVEGRKYSVWLEGLVGPYGTEDRIFTVHRHKPLFGDAAGARNRLIKDLDSITRDGSSVREILSQDAWRDPLRLEKVTKILESEISLQDLKRQLDGLQVDGDGGDPPSDLKPLLFGPLKEYVKARMMESEISHTCMSAIGHS